MSQFWNQLQGMGNYQPGSAQQNQIGAMQNQFAGQNMGNWNDLQLQMAAQKAWKASQPMLNRADFTPEQLQAAGRSMGDANAFTTHPQAQQTWETGLARGTLSPRALGMESTMPNFSQMDRSQLEQFMSGFGGSTGQPINNTGTPGLQPNQNYYSQGQSEVNTHPVGSPVPLGAALGGVMPGAGGSMPGTNGGALAGMAPSVSQAGQSAATATGGSQNAISDAINANPALLEEYWKNNPDAMRTAIGGNPSLFAPSGLRRDSNVEPPTGLIGSERAMYGGLLGGMDQIAQYQQEGKGASQLQAALSGALGPQAQAEAYANYQESPGQEYLRDRSEQAILRNSAATGGLGGGNVQQALQRNAIGLAAQDFDNSFNRLGVTAGRGYDAARTSADMTYGTGQSLAGGRTRAGELMANNYGQTAQSLAGLQSQYGNNFAELLGNSTNNLANLLGGAGQSNNQNYQQLAALLANIATGQGTTVAGLPGIPGVSHQPGILGDLGKLAMGAAAFSDARLKRNIRNVGQTPKGVNLYTWDWTEEGRALAGDQPGYGVIAQEVPWAAFAGADGYLRVDYSRIS